MAKKLPAKKISPKPSPPKKVPPKKRAPTPKKTDKELAQEAIAEYKAAEEARKQEDISYLSELSDDEVRTSEIEESTYTLESLKDDISISDPTPRADPNPKPATDIERLFNIKWSKYIPRIPTPKQLAALMLQDVKELLYGGALGGGKSDFLAYEALRFCDMPGFASIVFRRQLTDLKQPGSLMPRVAEWLEPFRSSGEARYVAQDHCWHFKTRYPGTDIPGAEALLQWGYIGDAAIRERYQSAEYQLVDFDELGQWSDSTDWTFMGSRIRATVCPIHKKDGNGVPIWHDDCHICSVKRRIPLRKRAAMNPGPAWVKRYFQIVPDPKVYKTRQAALIAMQEGEKINWVGIHPERKFIPAYLNDNPHLDGKDYKVMLAQMTEDERSRLEDGNWESRKNARFKRKWINGQYINIYDHGYSFLDVDMQESIILPFSSLKTIFTTTDAAATARLFVTGDDEAIAAADGRVSSKPSSTCIGVWGVTYTNQLLWLDFYKFRKELPTIVETLVEVNIKWKPSFNKIEANGLGIGVAQYAELAGLPVRKNTRKKDKLENSLSAQMMMKNGQIYMAANTPWAETAEDDIFNWTGLPDEEDDTVDILADAALEITPTMASKISLPMRRPAMPSAVSTTRGGGMIPTYGLPGSH